MLTGNNNFKHLHLLPFEIFFLSMLQLHLALSKALASKTDPQYLVNALSMEVSVVSFVNFEKQLRQHLWKPKS